jgi:hypothetical protein
MLYWTPRRTYTSQTSSLTNHCNKRNSQTPPSTNNLTNSKHTSLKAPAPAKIFINLTPYKASGHDYLPDLPFYSLENSSSPSFPLCVIFSHCYCYCGGCYCRQYLLICYGYFWQYLSVGFFWKFRPFWTRYFWFCFIDSFLKLTINFSYNASHQIIWSSMEFLLFFLGISRHS